MPQRSVKRETHFQIGQDISPNNDKKTRTNKDPQAKQVDTVAVSGADDDTTYELQFSFDTVNAFVSFTTDSSATIDELVNGLTNAINNNRKISGRLLAEADTGADDITITARYPGVGWTLTEEQDSPGHLSITNTTSNAGAVEIPFGIALERHGALNDERGHVFARKPDASNYTARDLLVTLDGSTDGDYRLKIEYHGGSTFVATYTASADSEDDILNNLRDDINNNGPSLLTASVDTGPSPSELHINPETAGFADFRIVEADGPSQIDESVDTEGTDFRELFDGIALAGYPNLIEPKVDGGRYQPNSHMNVLSDGLTAVAPEKDPADGNTVWVRLSANGSLDELGAFRPDFNSGCVPLDTDTIEWERVPKSGLATVRLNGV